jgi:peptidyl-prolyl cis-trans isomerase B (cyclophilin B)
VSPLVKGLSHRPTGFAAGLFGLAGATLALAGCGSSHQAHISAQQSTQAAVASSGTGKSSSACQQVRQPQPKGAQHLTRPALRLQASKTYRVRLTTNCGNIEIKLDAAESPNVVASFVYLVDIGFYDDLTFHRVVAGYLIQGGDPNGDGSGGPGYTVTERPPSNVQYTQGTVAMAKDPADPAGTSGSQFFIVTGKDIDLPPQYAVLGKVVGGLSTINAISQIPTTANPDGEDSEPTRPIVIKQATVEVG